MQHPDCKARSPILKVCVLLFSFLLWSGDWVSSAKLDAAFRVEQLVHPVLHRDHQCLLLRPKVRCHPWHTFRLPIVTFELPDLIFWLCIVWLLLLSALRKLELNTKTLPRILNCRTYSMCPFSIFLHLQDLSK